MKDSHEIWTYQISGQLVTKMKTFSKGGCVIFFTGECGQLVCFELI